MYYLIDNYLKIILYNFPILESNNSTSKNMKYI